MELGFKTYGFASFLDQIGQNLDFRVKIPEWKDIFTSDDVFGFI